MAHMYEEQCSAQVHNDFGVSFHQCLRNATVERDGRKYCTTHDPVRVKQRAAAQREKWAKQDEAYRAEHRRRMEMSRRAELFPEMLAALKYAKEIIDDQIKRFHSDCRCQLCESLPQMMNAAIAKAEGGK